MYHQLPLGSAPLHRFVDAPDPVGHDAAAGLNLVRVEVIRHDVELELEAADVVLVHNFFDDTEALVPGLGVLEVEAAEPRMVGIDAASGADLQVLVLDAKIGAAHRGVIGAAPLHDESRVNQDVEFGRSLADDAEGVVTTVDEALGVPGGAAEDLVIPGFDVVAHQLADAGVVQHRAPFAETKGDGFNGGAGQLLDHRDVFLPVHGRLVAVEVAVAGVVVEHDQRSVHGCSPRFWTSLSEVEFMRRRSGRGRWLTRPQDRPTRQGAQAGSKSPAVSGLQLRTGTVFCETSPTRSPRAVPSDLEAGRSGECNCGRTAASRRPQLRRTGTGGEDRGPGKMSGRGGFRNAEVADDEETTFRQAFPQAPRFQ